MVRTITEFDLIDAFLAHGLAVERISREIATVKGMDKATLATACIGQPLFRPKYCKNSYLRQLKRLLERFQFAPSSAEDVVFYLKDLELLLLFTRKLIEAGLKNCILVDFKPEQSAVSVSNSQRVERVNKRKR